MTEVGNSVLNLDLTVDVFDRLSQLAQLAGVPVEALVVQVLQQHLDLASSSGSLAGAGTNISILSRNSRVKQRSED